MLSLAPAVSACCKRVRACCSVRRLPLGYTAVCRVRGSGGSAADPEEEESPGGQLPDPMRPLQGKDAGSRSLPFTARSFITLCRCAVRELVLFLLFLSEQVLLLSFLSEQVLFLLFLSEQVLFLLFLIEQVLFLLFLLEQVLFVVHVHVILRA